VAAVSPLGDQLFVACAGSNDVYVINVNTRRIVKQFPVGLGPNGMAFSPDGATLYVSNAATNDLSIIDALELRELRRAPVGNRPFSMAVDSKGRIFVVETGDSALSVYSPQLQRLSTVRAGKTPQHILLSPDQSQAYVTDEKKNELLIFRID
jgi:YVTN family beta-propeller protein